MSATSISVADGAGPGHNYNQNYAPQPSPGAMSNVSQASLGMRSNVSGKELPENVGQPPALARGGAELDNSSLFNRQQNPGLGDSTGSKDSAVDLGYGAGDNIRKLKMKYF